MAEHNMRQISSVLTMIVLLMLTGCSDSSTSPETLSLTVEYRDDSYVVSNDTLYERPYQNNNQQGQFQAHLLNQEGDIIQKVNFDRMMFSDNASKDSGEIQVLLPMLQELHKIKIYELDGSSGHYVLKDTKPITTWTVPSNTLNKD